MRTSQNRKYSSAINVLESKLEVNGAFFQVRQTLCLCDWLTWYPLSLSPSSRCPTLIHFSDPSWCLFSDRPPCCPFARVLWSVCFDLCSPALPTQTALLSV